MDINKTMQQQITTWYIYLRKYATLIQKCKGSSTTGAVIHGGQFSISINSVIESSKSAMQEAELKPSPKRGKRLKVPDFDPG